MPELKSKKKSELSEPVAKLNKTLKRGKNLVGKNGDGEHSAQQAAQTEKELV